MRLSRVGRDEIAGLRMGRRTIDGLMSIITVLQVVIDGLKLNKFVLLDRTEAA